jgi:Uma2 family endonuclease
MAITVPLLTAEDLLQLPKDGFRYELIRGELRKMPPAGDEHGDVTMQFGWRLAQHVKAHDLGKVYAAETGFLLATNPDTVRAPDVAFVRKERVQETGRITGFRPGAPDLVVEVISPGDTYSEVEEKALEWLRAGSQVVLLVNPRHRTVTVYRSFHEIHLLTEGDILSVEDVVPGWTLSIHDLFQ